MNTWSERICHWSSLSPDAIALVDERWTLSFSELDANTAYLIRFLKSKGIKPSDRVVLALPRSTSLAVFVYALLRAEIPGLIVDRGYIAATIKSVAASLQPKAVICLSVDQPLVLEKFGEHGGSWEAIGFSLLGERPNDEFVALVDRSEASNARSPSNLRWMLQTSGTTKEPRIVMIGEKSLHARASGEVRDFCLTASDRILNHLSFSHDLGLNQLLSTLFSGAVLRIQTGPLILSLAKVLNEFAPTGITGTPMMWVQLLNAANDQYPSLRYVTVSGGSLLAAELQRLKGAFPNATILRTYGQTETFRTLLNTGTSDPSLGRPLTGVNAFIINIDQSECKVDEPGELVHAGEGEMLGYWNDEVATGQKMTSLGIRTGDLFKRDSNGLYYYLGRNDDMLKRFEHRFSISEVEAVILDTPGVAEAAVCMKPAPPSDPRQILLAAFVRLSEGAAMSPHDLLRELQLKLPSFKVPDQVIFINELPKTISFKPDRASLQKRWLNEP